MINDKTYRGQIDPVSVFNAVCAGFSEPPMLCWHTLGKQPPKLPSTSEVVGEAALEVGELVTIILAFILVNVVVLYCCRRRQRRQFKSELNTQIES